MDNIFSIGEVAKLLGIQQYRISYAIVSGQLPEASFRFLGKRCFSEEDIERIAEHFGVQDFQAQRSRKDTDEVQVRIHDADSTRTVVRGEFS